MTCTSINRFTVIFCFVAIGIFTAGCSSSEEKARVLFNRALASERADNPQEAKEMLEQLVDQYPQTEVATQANVQLDQKKAREEMTAATIEANEKATRSFLRTILTAAIMLFSTNGEHPQSLFQIEKGGELPTFTVRGSPNEGIKYGYRFIFKSKGPKPAGYTISVHPINPGVTGNDYYFLDEYSSLRYNTGGPADDRSPEYQEE